MTILYVFTILVFILLSSLLCFVILIQESKSSGLGASFGGEVSDSLLGAGAADVLKKFTGWLALVFAGFCLVLSLWTSALGRAQVGQAAPSVEQHTDQ